MSPQLGCFGWLLLVAVCAWPAHELGASDTAAFISGVVVSSLVLVGVGAIHSRQRERETERALRRSREP